MSITPPPSAPNAADPSTTNARTPARRAGLGLGSLMVLIGLALGQSFRFRKLTRLVLLMALPAALALLLRLTGDFDDPLQIDGLGRSLGLSMIADWIAPILAIYLAAGMIWDEIEDQTLTYLMVRPLPRWSIYLSKFLGSYCLAVTLSCSAIALLALVVKVNLGVDPEQVDQLWPIVPTMAMVALLTLGYLALFALVGLIFRSPLGLGILYLVAVEWALSGFDFLLRQITLRYHARVVWQTWTGQIDENWSIDPETAPDLTTSLAILIGASLILIVAGCITFGLREFRLKTPSGR